MNKRPRLLIVDDEEMALMNLEHILKKTDYEIVTAQSGPKGLELIKNEIFDVVLTDLRMEKVDGMRILEEARNVNPSVEVIMITGYATVDSAIEAMKKGAYHYISKPFRIDAVRKIVAEAVEKVRLRTENIKLKSDLKRLSESSSVKMITNDREVKRILEIAKQISRTECNVLISGESGTGKELLARSIHEQSERAKGIFMAVNCGVFSEDLLSNELFGHEKGSYTGADSTKPGLIELAKGGTLFLDEITEMSLNMQVKLLRVIQERQILRVGGSSTIGIDIRFVAASNRNIQEAVQSGEFRKDLYYRLNVVHLHLPPLASRKSDIPILIQHFLEKHSRIMSRRTPSVTREVLELLKEYDFPGNIRELENIIERGVALAPDSFIGPEHLPDDIRDFKITAFRKRDGKFPTLEEQEIEYIRKILQDCGGNKTLAAETLGIDRVSLWRKIKRYALE